MNQPPKGPPPMVMVGEIGQYNVIVPIFPA
jgi:hypothetical protein